jgi:hypothetical protein
MAHNYSSPKSQFQEVKQLSSQNLRRKQNYKRESMNHQESQLKLTLGKV